MSPILRVVEPELVHLNVKLLPGADASAALKRLLVTPGVKEALQTFPDETDQELRGLYSLKVDRPQAQDIIDRLRHDSAVDFVEMAAPRKLIAPVRKSGRH